MVEINKQCKKCGTETSLDQKFCNKCGNQVETEKSTQYCGSCGTETTYPENICKKCGSKVNLSSFQYEENKQDTTNLWYLFPILFGIFGGVTAWALLRESDYKMATKCLLVGIGVTILHVIIIMAGLEFDNAN